MGWKYEVAIWAYQPSIGYEYQTVYVGNSLLGLARAYWDNRRNGCVKVEVRR